MDVMEERDISRNLSLRRVSDGDPIHCMHSTPEREVQQLYIY